VTYTELKALLAENGALTAVDGSELVLRAPKGVLTRQVREAVAAHKKKLVVDCADLPQLRPDPEHVFEPFPLTDIQQAYWLGRNPAFELGGIGIHVYEEIECTNLDPDRLDEAWQKVVARHDMLRAVVTEDGRQRILPFTERRISRDDLSSVEPEVQQQRLETWRAHLSHKTYVPELWPMFDIVVCRLDERRHYLIVSIDALNIDMRSFQVIFQDWADYYDRPGRALQAIHISYRDYALALATVNDLPAYRCDWDYWKTAVQGMSPAPALPLAKPLASLQQHHFCRRGARVDTETWTRMKSIGADYGLTPSVVLLAAYAEVLRHWSDEPSFTVNVTLFNALPLHPDLRKMAGDFTSMLLIGAEHPAGSTFAERACSLQTRMSEGLEHRLVSGLRVLREFARTRGFSSHQSVMPIVFTSTLHSETRGLLPLRRFGRRVYNIIQTPQVLMDLQVHEDHGSLVYQIDTVDEAFPKGMVDEMFSSFGALIESLVSVETWPAARPPVPQKSLPEANATAGQAAPCREKTISDYCWGAAADEKSPALITSDCKLSRAELLTFSRNIASSLQAAGLRCEDVVGVLFPKGWRQVAAIHGAVLAGGAYLPLDTEWPSRRLKSLLQDAHCRFVIAERTPADLPAGIQVIPFETESAIWQSPEISPRNLAYVLYTSGSTGLPKGVMIEHRSVVNRFEDVNARFSINASDRVLGLTAAHHDLSVYDLFGIVAAGGAIVIPDAAEIRNPEHWASLMVREGVTIWNSVPAFLEMLLDYLESTDDTSLIPRSLRLILIAGDWIPVTLPDRVSRLMPWAKFISLGGPTETTVWDICHPVERSYADEKSVPYGTPMRHAKYFVMDHDLRERPYLAAGELCIAGIGLARGYLGDAEMTRERFVAHPDTGQRIYRSGDLGRLRPDGVIEILGRIDHQIKIRGQRIEPSEVEEAIRKHPQVDHVAVQAIADQNGAKRLIAFVTPTQNGAEEATAANQWELRLRHAAVWDDSKAAHVNLAPRETEEERRAQAHARRSHRRFGHEPVTLVQLRDWLSCLLGYRSPDHILPKFRYPSAGSLYPVRTYISIAAGRVEGTAAGVYYYHPLEARLSLVQAKEPPADLHIKSNRCLAHEAAFTVYLIGHLPAICPIYGESSRNFCLIESGYIGQLLMDEAKDVGLGLCPLGAVDTSLLRSALRLTDDDLFLHALAGGRADPRSPTSGVDSNEEWVQRMHTQLRSVLPAALIPDEVILLDKLPLTANGKLDRQALASVASARPVYCDAASEKPASEAESGIATIVAEVLEVPHVPIRRKFFEIGCDSVHLVRMMTRIRAQSERMGLSREVRIPDFFAYPTVELLAGYLTCSQRGAEAVAEAARIRGQKRYGKKQR
jgi:epothilone synthetase B